MGNELLEASQARTNEQCMLMRLVGMGVINGSTNPKSKSGYKNIKILQVEEVDTLISKITRVNNAETLFNVCPKDLAGLQPYIRIFKVFEDQSEVELQFSEGSFFGATGGAAPAGGVRSIFSSRRTRGSDVGVESVNFELLATQPAEVSNNIVCNMVLFFQNIDSLLVDRTATSGGNYRYADLILRPPSKQNETQYKAEHYRIRLAVGWSVPRSMEIPQSLKTAIEKSQINLNLTLKNHTFNFEMDGTARLDIEYHAWVEGALSSPETNLLYTTAGRRRKAALNKIDGEITKKSKEKQDIVGAAAPGSATPGTPPGSNPQTEQVDREISEQERNKQRIRNQQRFYAYKRLLDKMLNHDPRAGAHGRTAKSNFAMYYLDVPSHQLAKKEKSSSVGLIDRCGETFRQSLEIKRARSAEKRNLDNASDEKGTMYEAVQGMGTDGWDIPGLGDNTGATNNEDLTNAANEVLKKLKPGQAPKDASKKRISYFYLGELIDAFYDILGGNSDFEESPSSKVKLILGPTTINNPCTAANTMIRMNIADIPVSLNLFQAWYVKKVIAPQRSTYLLRNFLSDLLGELLPAAMGTACEENAEKKVARVESTVLTVHGKELPNIITNIEPSSAATVGPGTSKKIWNYLLFYTTGISTSRLTGSTIDDLRSGILHLILGKECGIIKSFKFEKNDAPYLGEAKVVGTNDLANDLAGGAIYNFNAEMIGNNLFTPGQMIYINARQLSPDATGHEALERMRIGGYYMVDKVESDLSRGGYTTSISAIWQSTSTPAATQTAPAVSNTATSRTDTGETAKSNVEKGAPIKEKTPSSPPDDPYKDMPATF